MSAEAEQAHGAAPTGLAELLRGHLFPKGPS
jgi:hypothetical protein